MMKLMIFTSTGIIYLSKLLISTCHSKGNASEAISCPRLLLRSPLQFTGVTSFSRNLRELNVMIIGNNLRSREPCYHLKRQVYEILFHPGFCWMCHPGEFWKKLKPLLPSKSTQQQHIKLLEEGQLITDNMEIANIFNKHFIHGVAAHISILSEHAFADHLKCQ